MNSKARRYRVHIVNQHLGEQDIQQKPRLILDLNPLKNSATTSKDKYLVFP